MNYTYNKWHLRLLKEDGKPFVPCNSRSALSLLLEEFRMRAYTERCQRCSTALSKLIMKEKENR
jgi:hypothetical protein